MRLVAAAILACASPDPGALRDGLDTLYAGRFDAATRYFAALAAARPRAAAPVVFQAGAYIWWAAALQRDDFERARIDSLLGIAIARARIAADDFWLATAYGYRARQRELRGDGLGAAQDAKRMRSGYRRILAGTDCPDCLLGLGLFDYGVARSSTVARVVARIIGLGGGDAERGIGHIRRAATHGDLARTEATWVLAAALVREGHRDPARREALFAEARALVRPLAARYPGNPLFTRFLTELGEGSDNAQRPTLDAPAQPATRNASPS